MEERSKNQEIELSKTYQKSGTARSFVNSSYKGPGYFDVLRHVAFAQGVYKITFPQDY